MTTSKVTQPYYPNETRWQRFSIPDQLTDPDGLANAEIASVTYIVETPLTEVGGSSVVYTRSITKDSVKARFAHNGAAPGRYSVTAVMVTNDGETIEETKIVVIIPRPT